MGCASCVFRFVKWAIIVTSVVFAINYWLANKSYVFTESGVAKIALKHLGSEPSKSFDLIHKELKSLYRGHILPKEDLQWIFVNAGGWMGSMCVVHASLTEYVLFFGTAMDTSGHSGRYWANVTDVVLSGDLVQWKEAQMSLTHNIKGSVVRHVWGEAAGVSFVGGTWAVEYARGFIPSALPFALSDTFFSTRDFVSLFYLFRAYTKALLLEMSSFVVSVTS